MHEQAYGGGGGAVNVDVKMRGTDWQWGTYALDQVPSIPLCDMDVLFSGAEDCCFVVHCCNLPAEE